MKQKYKRLILVVFSLVIAVSGLWLILDSLNKNIVFFLTPTELKSQPSAKLVRVGGMVKENSIIKLKNSLTTTFIITDMQTDLKIQYTGLVPSLFREKQGIVAKGKLTDDNIFIAEELLAKHDENYMPKEVSQGYMKF